MLRWFIGTHKFLWRFFKWAGSAWSVRKRACCNGWYTLGHDSDASLWVSERRWYLSLTLFCVQQRRASRTTLTPSHRHFQKMFCIFRRCCHISHGSCSVTLTDQWIFFQSYGIQRHCQLPQKDICARGYSPVLRKNELSAHSNGATNLNWFQLLWDYTKSTYFLHWLVRELSQNCFRTSVRTDSATKTNVSQRPYFVGTTFFLQSFLLFWLESDVTDMRTYEHHSSGLRSYRRNNKFHKSRNHGNLRLWRNGTRQCHDHQGDEKGHHRDREKSAITFTTWKENSDQCRSAS